MGQKSGALKVFDLNEGRLSRNLVGHKTNITCLQYHPISEYVVSGSKDCAVKVWDVRNKECLSSYTGHEKEVTCVRFSPDGRWVASSAKDGLILVWDMVAGKHLETLKINPSYVTSFEFNPQEFLLAAATNSRAVRVWDLESMDVLFTAPPEQSAIKALGFSPNKPILCTASKEAVKSWTWEGEKGRNGSNSSVSLSLAGVQPMSSDGASISSLRVSKSGNITGASCISNFASIYRTNLEDMATDTQRSLLKGKRYGVALKAAEEWVSTVDNRPPFTLYGNPGGMMGSSPGPEGTTTTEGSHPNANSWFWR